MKAAEARNAAAAESHSLSVRMGEAESSLTKARTELNRTLADAATARSKAATTNAALEELKKR